MYNPPQIQQRLKECLPLNDIEMNLHTCLYPVVKKLEIVRKKAFVPQQLLGYEQHLMTQRFAEQCKVNVISECPEI